MGIPLEPTDEQFRAMGAEAIAFAAGLIADLPDAPANGHENFAASKAAAAAIPPIPEHATAKLGDLLPVLAPAFADSINTAGPGYVAYIPGGGLATTAIADFITLSANRAMAIAEFAPQLVAIEQSVLRWICDLYGYPAEARGLLTTGGSVANLTAIVTARHARFGDDDFRGGAIFVTDQVHASATKAARLAGFPLDAVHPVATDARMRMDPTALQSAVDDARGAGRTPFLVVASAGTTNTGAIDPMPEIAGIAAAQDLWLHVDAAYGGFFQLTDRGRAAFAGLERADSITLDPHKGLFLPYGTGCLIVRDGRTLLAAHETHAAYLQDLDDDAAFPDYAHYSSELSRELRGLRVWLPLQLHGVEAFRAALDEKLDLARHFADGIRDVTDLVVEPELSVVPFRARDGGSPEETDARSKELLRRVNEQNRVIMSSTTLRDRFTLRCAILSHRTHRDRVDEAIAAVREAAST